MSTETHADAFKALLTTAAKVPAYELDEIRALATPPNDYVEVYLSPRAGGEYRFDGSRDVSLRRLSTRVVTLSVTNGQRIEGRIAAAFAHTTINLGDTTTQVDYESGGGAFEYDDGFYTALTDWTYSL